MTLTRAQFFATVEQHGLFSPDYAGDVLVRIAHHSAAIEGNTLSVADAISLLIEDRTPTAGKPLRELYEVANHREAFARVLAHAVGDEPLTTTFIREIHAALLDHILEDRGQWKATANAILGATRGTAPPEQVPWRMTQWAENTTWQASHLDGDALAYALADAHADFEGIHPFSDGNGRTGRMLLLWQSLRATGLPVIIEVGQRPRYIDALRDDDRADLADLISEQWAREQDRHAAFHPEGG